MENLYELGVSFVLFWQSLGGWLLEPMKFFSSLGTLEFFLLIMPILYWCFDSHLGLRVLLILIISGGIFWNLKLVFHTPRPFWYSRDVTAYAFEESFGVPSGHAQNSAAVLGYLAATLKRRWVWVVMLILIFLISISRVYLAVHFPQDVIAGWIIGFLLVWIFLRLEKPVAAWLEKRNLIRRILAALVCSLALLLIGLMVREMLGRWELPSAWVENARWAFPDQEPINPFDINGLLAISGVFFGSSAGALWLAEFGGFDARGEWWKRIVRYIIGVAGIAFLWFGLRAVLPDEMGNLGYLVYYLWFVLIGLWISALAPFLFMSLKLAEPNNQKTL